MPTLNDDVKKLYGVGKVRAAAYEKLNIRTVGELLEHYPRGYENRGDVKLLSQADGISKSAHVLTVATAARSARIRGRMSLLKFRAFDDSGICDVTFFNQDYLKDTFTVGSTFRFWGKVEQKGKNFSMTSPAYEPYDEEIPMPALMPVYRLTEGLSQKQISKDMASAMSVAALADQTEDHLPEEIRRRHSLCVLSYALRNIHVPDSFVALAAAKKRLIFDEFFTFALGVSMSSGKTAKNPAYPCSDTNISPLLDLLPYELTAGQKRAISDISRDMSRGVAMNRILVGDVGCGKTVCAAAAMYIAVKNGRQAAIMAPTEILANQHFADISELFSKLGISVGLLTGSVTAAQKKKIRAQLIAEDPNERLNVVIGTQALLSDGVEFAAPGIVIADEQHRFGVNQRAVLAEKSRLTHMLVMSATPIPRSLALAVYGDLDISKIEEMPAGRQRVDTFVVNEDYRERLNAFIKKQVYEGGQVYIVCPAIEEKAPDDDGQADVTADQIDDEGHFTPKTPLKSAEGLASSLAELFPDIPSAYLHGKLKSVEKDAIMGRFERGEIKILVSTTVVEVGVNVPNASLMIVENAERFGLSQLHQLRGRVGRGMRKSFCVLVSQSMGQDSTAGERLSVMKNSYNGFEIAERDLQMRGPGDFLKANSSDEIRQSGGIKFRLAELCDDTGLMSAAFSDAKELLSRSPDLSDFPALKASVEKLFTPQQGTIN